MTISWSTRKDFKQVLAYKREGVVLDKSKSYKYMIVDLIVSKIIYYAIFLVIPILVLPISWAWILLFYFMRHFISGFILSAIFQTAHVVPSSEYPLPDSKGQMKFNWAIHQLHTTANYAPNNRIFSWLIGGLNYQVEHHLFPTISHVHYRAIAVMVKETAQKYSLPYYVQPSFFAALRNHYVRLKTLGRS